MDRMDCFLPLFQGFLSEYRKKKKKHENFNFLLVGFTLFRSLLVVFLLGINMGGNLVCTLLLTGKHDWSIS